MFAQMSIQANVEGLPHGIVKLHEDDGAYSDHISITTTGSLAKIVFPKSWYAGSIRDLDAAIAVISRDEISVLEIDLSQTKTVSFATMWLVDKLQWACIENNVGFNIIASNALTNAMLKALEVSLKRRM